MSRIELNRLLDAQQNLGDQIQKHREQAYFNVCAWYLADKEGNNEKGAGALDSVRHHQQKIESLLEKQDVNSVRIRELWG